MRGQAISVGGIRFRRFGRFCRTFVEIRPVRRSPCLHLDVRRAYLDYRRAEQDLDGIRKSRQLARQWLQEARDEYDFDPEAIGELIAAFEAWSHLEQGYSQAIYDFNLSVAKLEKITGGLELSFDDATSP